MSKSSRPQKGDRHKADGTKETLQNEELVEFAATIPHAEYSEIDRYWRKMGWLSISSFLASAAHLLSTSDSSALIRCQLLRTMN